MWKRSKSEKNSSGVWALMGKQNVFGYVTGNRKSVYIYFGAYAIICVIFCVSNHFRIGWIVHECTQATYVNYTTNVFYMPEYFQINKKSNKTDRSEAVTLFNIGNIDILMS